MSQYAPKSPKSMSRSSDSASSSQTSDADNLQLQRLLQSASLSPQMAHQVQRHLGNQGIQRLMRQAQTVTAPQRPHASLMRIQRTAPIQHRTGKAVMQRGLFGYIKNKIKKYIRNEASEATFGSDADRQANPEETAYDFEKANDTAFSAVNVVDVPSGPKQEHKLKGRHFLAKDPTKGPYAGKTVLFLSGSGGTAEQYSKETAIYYCKKGANVLAVNYRGFGRSKTSDDKGKDRKMTHTELTDTMLYEDARAMFKWLQDKGVDPGSVIVHGYSLGGAMAANLVATLAGEGIRVAGLVFHSAIDSARKVAVRSMGSVFGNLGADNLGSEFDTIAAMQEIATKYPELQDLPIAVMSGSHQKKDSAGKKKDEDHLDDNLTNLSSSLGKMGFTNVGSKVHADESHEANHLKRPSMQGLLEGLLGTKPKPKDQQLAEDGVKTV